MRRDAGHIVVLLDVTQRWLVVIYRPLGTAYLSHLRNA